MTLGTYNAYDGSVMADSTNPVGASCPALAKSQYCVGYTAITYSGPGKSA